MLERDALPSLSDVAAYKNEWEALVECASPFHDGARVSGLLARVDWQRLLLLAEEHGVIAHLVTASNDASAEVPQGARQRLLEREHAQNFLTLRLTAELLRLLELFAANNISALAIKGPVLAMRAYGNPAMRAYGDLDLLVRHADIRGATEVLLAVGFEATVSLGAIDAGRIPGQYLFSKPDSQLHIELHNDLTLRYFPRPLPIEDFFSRQVRVPLDAQETPALAVEDELVLISIHGAKHFWERLIWIADVAGLISRQTGMDWERAAESARMVSAEHQFYTALQLASDLLGAPLPEQIRSQAQADLSATKLVEKILGWLPAAGYAPPGLFTRAAFRLRMRGGLFAAPAYLLRLSLSPTEEDWQREGQPSQNGFLDALRRPFRLARKYGRGPQGPT